MKKTNEAFSGLIKKSKEEADKLNYDIPKSIDEDKLTIYSKIKIISIVEENKETDSLPKFTVGKTYPIADFGDGLCLEDDGGGYDHVSYIELFYNIEIA